MRLPQIRASESVTDDTADAVASESRYVGRFNRLCLEAAYLGRIEGKSELEIRVGYLVRADMDAELRARIAHKDLLQKRWRATSDGPKPTKPMDPRDAVGLDSRDRTARRVIQRGDRLWARLGAWPFAVFDGELPHGWHGRWRDDPGVERALRNWYECSRQAPSLRCLRRDKDRRHSPSPVSWCRFLAWRGALRGGR
jgi:hypothetical protein